MSRFAASDFALFQNALIYTVAVRAVNKIVDERDGSVLALLLTAAILTFGAQSAATRLRDEASNDAVHLLVKPIHAAGAFICETLVSVGINMQSTLLGAYLSAMFSSDAHPVFVLASSAVGLVLLWVLGVACGATR